MYTDRSTAAPAQIATLGASLNPSIGEAVAYENTLLFTDNRAARQSRFKRARPAHTLVGVTAQPNTALRLLGALLKRVALLAAAAAAVAVVALPVVVAVAAAARRGELRDVVVDPVALPVRADPLHDVARDGPPLQVADGARGALAPAHRLPGVRCQN